MLSRFGPRSKDATDLIAKLSEKDVKVLTPACNVSDTARLSAILEDYATKVPPIKGCIQGSIVLKVSSFPCASGQKYIVLLTLIIGCGI